MGVKEEMERRSLEIEEIIKKYLPKEEGYQKTIFSAMNYSILAGGKRLRPMLMKETYELFGGKSKIIEPFMAAIEMIHTYSLVHDDLPAMDNDEYRRGKKTTPAVYGEAMGILAGDALLNYAFETATLAFDMEPQNARIGRALRILATKAGVFGMVGGQTVDVESEDTQDMTKEKLDFIYRLKTSALIEASMLIGAVLAGATKQEQDTIEQAAAEIGLAFQIQDDILDVTSTLEVLGKPIGSDEKKRREEKMNRTLIKKLILILLGNFILAFGVNCFMVSTGIIMGGATGIGLAVNKFTGINLSYVVWVLNFILFFLGLFFMGKAFAMSIILSTFFYPLCLNVLERIPGIMHLTDNLLLADIYGGVLVGLGIGLVVRQGASTGGLDIPPLIMQKKFGIPVGISLYVCDFTVLVMQAFFSTSDQVLYGILNVFLSSMVVNYVTVMGERKVQLLVISDKYEEIRKELLTDMDLGVTLVHVETGYMRQEQMAVLCVTTARKLYGANLAIQTIDPRAFISITNISEVRGRGFTLERKYK